MREKPRRAQLVLEWTGAMQWNELPTEARAELHALLRQLLRHTAHGDADAEGTVDE
jgi:hypothetical protein